MISSYESFVQLADKGNLVPVWREVLADTETPVSAFLKIKKGPYAFLLESVTGGEKWGRYSFLGAEPAVVVRGEGQRVTVTRAAGESQSVADGNPLLLLKQILAEYRPAPVSGLPRFWGGAIGFIGYEAVRFFESVPLSPTPWPDFLFLIPSNLLIFDNVRHRIMVISNVFLSEGDDRRVAYDRAVAEIEATLQTLAGPLPVSSRKTPPQPVAQPTATTSNMTREAFKSAVLAAKEYIRAGDIFQVQISRRVQTPITVDPIQIYRMLRDINPSPYIFYLQFGPRCLVGASPEVLVRLEGDQVETRPIAGTRRRGASPEEDQALAAELLADPKERAEHLMLVDLGRNDVGRIAAHGTVAVDAFMVVERYSHVMHIVSSVTGRLAPGRGAFDVLAACFPAGTVTGAPKIRAMEIIQTLEPPGGRGVYAGAVGYFGFDGNMDMAIAIRTIVIDGNTASVQAAAGIVADSDPDLEYEETVNKAKAMLAAIVAAEWAAGTH